MNPLTIHRILWPAVLVLSLNTAAPVRSQELAKLTLPLSINEQQDSFASLTIQFDNNGSGQVFLGQAPGGVLISKERVNDPPYAYRIRIDSDGDGNLANELPLLLLPNSSVSVRVTRKWANGKQRSLPYTIGYSRELNVKNQTRELLWWRSHYRAEGKLKFGNCESLFVAADLNGDGLFDEPDGSLTLVETSLRVPKIGAPLPRFSLTTAAGETVRLDELKGTMHLLDFWASWCKPCVENFSLVKQLSRDYGDGLRIIAVNVDEAPRLPMARQIIKDYQLKWTQVINGQGEADPLWKALGGMENNQLSIPLYVLVDSKGVLRYAGNGGEDLSERRKIVEEVRKAN